MENQEKTAVREAVLSKIKQKQLSDSQASKEIGISSSYMSHLRNDKTEAFGPETWNLLANWSGYRRGWGVAKTAGLMHVQFICGTAHRAAQAICLCDEPGSGKTFGLKYYQDNNKNAIYIQCEEYMVRATFLRKIAQALFINASHHIADMVDAIADEIRRRGGMLIILDEVDKLKDAVFALFKTLYDATRGSAGFVLCGAPYLRDRLDRGVLRNKQSFVEIYSRLGREVVRMTAIRKEDVVAVCLAQGIASDEQISAVLKKSKIKNDTYDLRAVERSIVKLILIQKDTNNGNN